MARAIDRPGPVRPFASLGAAGGLLRRLPRNRAALAILAGIAFVISFSLAALPGFVARMSDDGLRRAVADARPFQRHVTLTQVSAVPLGPGGAAAPSPRTIADVDAAGAALQTALPTPLRDVIARRTVVIDAPRWSVRELPGATPAGSQRFLQLRLQSGIDAQIALTAGRLPAPRPPATLAQLTGNPAAGDETLPVYETALSPATATALGVGLGDRLIATTDPAYLRSAGLRAPPPNYRLVVEIVGLIAANAPDDDYWLDDASLIRPSVIETPDVTMIYSTGLLAPDAFQPLQQITRVEPWTYQWRYFVDPARLDQDGLAEFEAAVRRLSLIYPPPTRAATGLAEIARRFADQRLFAVSILALAAAGLAATALAILGVLASLLAERRRAGTALVRGRGASPGQLAAAQAAEGLIATLPACLLGGALALAWLRPPSPALPALAALATALVATAALVVAAVPGARQEIGAATRSRGGARRTIAPRLVVEGLIVILAAAGVVLLRRRGLAGTGQRFDPYLVAVPILLGLAVGIVALRLLPLAVRAIAPATARGRGLVPLLAVRRLARPPGAQLPTLAVLLAVTLATFASIVRGSIGSALDEAAWRRVGADYRIDVPVPAGQATPPALDLAGIAGIAASARGELFPTVPVAPSALRLGEVALLAIDPAAYAAVGAGSPADAGLAVAALTPAVGSATGKRESPIPAIVSSRWVSTTAPRAGDSFALDFGNLEVYFVVRDVRADFPGLEPGQPFVIAPLAGLRAVPRVPNPPIMLTYARGTAEAAAPLAAALRAQLPVAADALPGTTPTLTARRAEYDRARGQPLVAGVTTGFLWAGALIALLALGAVVAAAEQAGRERAHERGYLRLLGLRPREARALALLELLPPLALAAIIGGALGVALIAILGPAIDLTAFAAPGQPIALRPDWPGVGLLVLAVLVVATVAGTLAGGRANRPGEADELLREVNR